MRCVLAVLALSAAACTTIDGPSGPAPAAPASQSVPAGDPARPSDPPARPPLGGPPRLVQIGTFDSPLFAAAPAGDPRIFVVEKAGRITVFKDNRVLPAPFLDIAGEVSDEGERGLLSMAFAPDYATTGRVYVNYTAGDGDVTLAEYTVDRSDPDRLDPASRRVLLEVPHPNTNHNGGRVGFGPDGMLYLSIGDGGGANDPDDNAQDLGELLGKLLRVDPRGRAEGLQYAVPADNPFPGRRGVRPEIYAYGLRNPWRWSFGPDGTFYVGDVGQFEVEELDAVPAGRLRGANFGWPAYEGRRRTAKRAPSGELVEPVQAYEHSAGGCAITAGYLDRGRVTALRGRFLYADFCAGTVLAVGPGGTGTPEQVGLEAVQLSSFGEDGFGDVVVTSLAGPVYVIAN
jgi:glucose/arabinose dehydrogenase